MFKILNYHLFDKKIDLIKNLFSSCLFDFFQNFQSVLAATEMCVLEEQTS